MTLREQAKEKAIELVNKMYGSDLNDFKSLKNNHPENFQLAKDCALIAVDEVRENIRWITDIQNFWLAVKAEIENL